MHAKNFEDLAIFLWGRLLLQRCLAWRDGFPNLTDLHTSVQPPRNSTLSVLNLTEVKPLNFLCHYFVLMKHRRYKSIKYEAAAP